MAAVPADRPADRGPAAAGQGPHGPGLHTLDTTPGMAHWHFL